jgi:hypothetical protein
VAGPCEHDNEPSGSINGGTFLTSQVTSHKQDSSAWSKIIKTYNVKCIKHVLRISENGLQ